MNGLTNQCSGLSRSLPRYHPKRIKYRMKGQSREHIKPGVKVAIVLKQDQRTGRLTEGIVSGLLTKSSFHPHGIKVRLTDGQVGRVQKILEGN